MPSRNEPIPLDNLIEILEVYISKLDDEHTEETKTMQNVFVWSLNYLRSYRDGISSIFPHIHL